MSIEIISIGNELLSGKTINTNSSTLAHYLLLNGWGTSRITTLPDERAALKRGIEEAMARSSFIIITGGLGSTGDDLTREVIADIVGTTLIVDEPTKDALIARFGSSSPTIENQSMVLKCATITPNMNGTAPGFIIEKKACLIVLPGVPAQMEAMLPSVFAYLEKVVKKENFTQTLYLCLLSEAEVDPYLRALEKQYEGVTIGICPDYGRLALYLVGKDQLALAAVKEKIFDRFNSYVYSSASNSLSVAIHQWMIANGKTFAAAESCSGGALSAALTAIPGASHYFLGAVVSYSNQLKQSALGVANTTLEREGAVSEKTVIEMVEGVRLLTGADYALSISGVMGPSGATEHRPIGTVWSALLTPDKIFTGSIPKKPFSQTREVAIHYCVNYLLASLWRFLNHHIEPFL